MAAGDNNLDIALRIKAEAGQAKAALAEVQAQVKGVETQVNKSNAAQVKSTRDVVAAQDAAMVSYKKFTELARNADAALTTLKSGKLTTAAFEKAVNDLGKAVDAGALTQEEYVAALKLADKAKVEDIVVTKAQTAANREAMLNTRAQSEIATAASEVLSGNFGRLRRTGAAFANQAGLLSKLMTPMGLAITAAAAAVGALAVAMFKSEAATDKMVKSAIYLGSSMGLTTQNMLVAAEAASKVSGASSSAAKEMVGLVAATGRITSESAASVAAIALEVEKLGGNAKDVVSIMASFADDPVKAMNDLVQKYNLLDVATINRINQLAAEGRAEEAQKLASDVGKQAMVDNANAVLAQEGSLKRMAHDVGAWFKDMWDAIGNVGAPSAQPGNLAQQAALRALEDKRDYNRNMQSTLQGRLDRGDWTGPNGKKALEDGIANYKRLADAQQAAIGNLRAQAVATDNLTAAQKALQRQTADAAEVAEQHETKDEQYQRRSLQYLNTYNAIIDKLKKGGGTKAQADQAFSNYQTQLAGLWEDVYGKDKPTKAPRGPLGIDRAQLSADVAAVQNAIKQIDNVYQNGQKTIDAQHKAGLVSDSAYYDAERGMLTAWENDKVAALEKEKTAAQSHVKTQADRIKADQKVAEIDQQITQVHADASAKRQQIDANEQQAIEKAENAWEQFRRSLGTPLEIHTDKVLAQLRELDAKFNKAGQPGGEAGYADALNRIFGGIDSRSPPGALIEGSRFAAQRAQVQTYYADVAQIQQAAYQQEMTAAQGNAQKQLDIQRAYEQASLQSAQRKAEAEAAIKRQEAQFALSSAQQGFASLAQVYAQAYGEQSKQARIAFALQKASTLANAILAIQESVANSSKMGSPWNIISIAGAIAQGAAVLATIRSTNLSVGGYAGGGAINGPGSGTSDSIPIWASNGEYMHNAAAVQHYGVGFMDAINSRRFPKLAFAGGGLIAGSAPTPSELGFKSPSTPSVNAAQVMVAVSPVTVIVHSSGGGDDVQSKQSTDNNGGQILELFIGAVAKDINNGGTTAKAMDRRWVLKRKGNSYG